MAFYDRRSHAATLRVSEPERDGALSALKAHYAQGRLSTAELEARVGDVYRSGTRREIALSLRDLPLHGLRLFVVGRVRRVQRTLLAMHMLTYSAINASLIGIWAVSGHGSFWPALFLIPSTALLAWHAALSRMLTRALARLRW